MVSASAMAAQRPEPAVPREVLASVLQKLILVDKEGYFQMPVDEKLHHAPNYYIIIKNPMCFHDMKNRLASGAYTTLRDMREDFELICSNARTFNKNTTKVYKAAMNLYQKGSKILKSSEHDLRKGPGSLARQSSDSFVTGGGRGASGIVSRSASLIGPADFNAGQAHGSGMDAAAAENGLSWLQQDYPGASDMMLSPGFFSPNAAGGVPSSWQAGGAWRPQQQPAAMQPPPLPPPPLVPFCLYVSDEEMEEEDNGAAAAASSAARRRNRRDVRRKQDEQQPLEQVLLRVARDGVQFRPWPRAAPVVMVNAVAAAAGPAALTGLPAPMSSEVAVPHPPATAITPLPDQSSLQASEAPTPSAATDSAAGIGSLLAQPSVSGGGGHAPAPAAAAVAEAGPAAFESSGRTTGWRRERGPIEWQCR